MKRIMWCLGLVLAGCGAEGPSASDPSSTPGGDPSRVIAEADIIQLAQGRLYAMSKSGTLSIVDVATPGNLRLLGQTTLQGQPFEMYLRGDIVLAMANGAASNGRALVIALDISDPAHIKTTATRAVIGELADSRVVGDVLYLATYEDAQCYGCGSTPRTLVTSFDISVPTALRDVDQASFQSNAPDSYNLPWGMHWKRSIVVNDQRMYIGGHADVDPDHYNVQQPEGIVDVLDISDPSGRLGRGPRLLVAGAVLSRWQLDEQDGILRVISQHGAGRTGNGDAMPEIQTFAIASTQKFTPLGETTMQLPMQEGLRSVRFDGSRAYAITYNQTDPLFVIDLTDPKHPQQRGQLSMPGFMYYLEPHGDRVIGLGVDRTDPKGSLNVSLFDVSNADAPKLLSRVAFAAANISEDYAILNGEVSEDQDRIQKAFRVFDDGLVVVPFTALRSTYDSGDTCANAGGGVQLVRWANDTLVKNALLPLPGNPRRAFEQGDTMVTVSDSEVRTFWLDDPTVATQAANVTIGTCVPDDIGGYTDEEGYGEEGCSVGRGGGGRGGAIIIGAALAFALGARRRR